MSNNAQRPEDDDYQSTNESDSSQSIRPNRWRGNPSTWRALTKSDRDIATSLTTARDHDLSVHLYNAHSLKRKANEIEDEKQNGKTISELEDTKGFVPPKTWVAWPLPPNEVPRLHEETTVEDGFDAFTLRKRERVAPSTELEDVLCATALRFAKDKFRKREFQGQSSTDIDGRSVKGLPIANNRQSPGLEEPSRDPSPARSYEEDYQPSASEAAHPSRKRAKGRKKEDVKECVPVVSKDDERSRDILRPSIRHTLSKLDEVLMALHHARATCFQVTKGDANGDGATLSDIGTPEMKPVGRPRKHPSSSIETPNSRKSNAGRPKKEYPRVEGETEQEYIVRIARLQKKPLPAFARSLNNTPNKEVQGNPKSSQKSMPHKAATEESIASRSKRLELRDWSEVLGAAAIVGFDHSVIQRATQRCATLFGESMSMRVLTEVPFEESKAKDDLRVYKPDMIPDFDSEEDSAGKDFSEQQNVPSQRVLSHGFFRARRQSVLHCSFVDCTRHKKPFSNMSALQDHLFQVHKVAYEDSDEESTSSDAEMDGAVHVDRFLRPMNFPLKAAVHGPRPRRTGPTSVKKPTRKSRSSGGPMSMDELDDQGIEDELLESESDHGSSVENEEP